MTEQEQALFVTEKLWRAEKQKVAAMLAVLKTLVDCPYPGGACRAMSYLDMSDQTA